MVQMTNATTPLTMDGDHFRFWVDTDQAQASLSAKISNVQSIQRYSPIDPNSTGLKGMLAIHFNVRSRLRLASQWKMSAITMTRSWD